eukprot:scaffold33858_cov70-Phaeocystis_antarctica.AAC.5
MSPMPSVISPPSVPRSSSTSTIRSVPSGGISSASRSARHSLPESRSRSTRGGPPSASHKTGSRSYVCESASCGREAYLTGPLSAPHLSKSARNCSAACSVGHRPPTATNQTNFPLAQKSR